MHLTKAFRKNIKRSITGSLGRYFAIMLIITLGVGFLAGLKLTNPVMLSIETNFIKEQNLYDYRYLSTIGFAKEDLEEISKLDSISVATGSITQDFISEKDNETVVYRSYMLTSGVNDVRLVEGRMPEKDNECLVDVVNFKSSTIGQKVSLSANNSEETFDSFKYKDYTIVGRVYSPLYISVERGTTSLGNGTLEAYVLIPEGGFDFEYYTEAYIKTNNDYEVYSDEYNDFIEELSPELQEKLKTALKSRYQDLYDDAKKELDDGRKELEDSKAEALEEFADAKKKLDDAKIQLADGKAQITENEDKLKKAKAELDDAKEQLDASASQMSSGASDWDGALADARQNLSTQKAAFSAQMAATKSQLDSAKAGLDNLKSNMDGLKQLIDAGYATAEQIATYNALKATYEQKYPEYQAGLATYEATKAQYEQQFATAEVGLDQFEAGVEGYRSGLKQYESGMEQIEEAKADYQSGLRDYQSGLKEYDENYAKFEKEIADAEKEIADGEKKLKELESPELYEFDRSSNTGYANFRSDASIVEKLSSSLPMFFFLIAALVCSTTMNRMVDDDRSLIGTMCAVGYGRREIFWKYFVYSGSAAFIGTLIGYFGGGFIFPKFIWTAYEMLYKIPGYKVLYDGLLFLVSLGLSLLCSVGVTFMTLRKEMANMPAELIRPKTPPAGKRILLERLPFIWNKIGFLFKVTLRNIFRFKKRMIMMVLGIAGCTGLVITGFGIKDSVADIVDYQYEDVMVYDLSVAFSDEVTDDVLEQVRSLCGDNLDCLVRAEIKAADVKGTTSKKSIYIVASDENLEQVIHFTDNDQTVPLPEEAGQALVTRKLPTLAGFDVNDTVTITIDDKNSAEVKLVSKVDNYVFNYIYMTADNYSRLYEEYEPNMVYIKLLKLDNENEIATKLMKLDGVASVSRVSTMKSMISKMMKSLDYVVALVIVSAAALAFVVLFNLGNINISERVREIATIKVLGFHANETSAYVFRENLILSIMGIAVGIPAGLLLHWYVINQVNIDMVSFKILVKPVSIAIACVFVLFCAIFTDLVLRRKIKRIDMAESLKSVE